MLKQKEIWDVVDEFRVDPTKATQTRRKKKVNIVTSKIIK